MPMPAARAFASYYFCQFAVGSVCFSMMVSGGRARPL
jgi:hypothetical protein